METTTFIRKPFVVEAIKITEDNIGDIAELVGELKTKRDGTPYIRVNRRLVPNVDNVYIGYWMTKMGPNIRCYAKRVFSQQFIEMTDEREPMVENLGGSLKSDYRELD